MLTLFLEMAINFLYLSSSLWSLLDLEKLKNVFQWQGLPHRSFFCLFMLLLVLNILPQPLQSNT